MKAQLDVLSLTALCVRSLSFHPGETRLPEHAVFISELILSK